MRNKADKELYDECAINGLKYEGKWGVVVFILGLVLLLCGYWLSGLLSQRFSPITFTKLFSYIGILTGAGALSVGYFSYPRIHNLKVFLAGYVTGISSLAFCIFSNAGIFSLRHQTALSQGFIF